MTWDGFDALDDGYIRSGTNSALCGYPFVVGKRYVIIQSGKLVGTNNYIREYSEVTPTEWRGLTRLYRRGCQCTVNIIFLN